MPTFDSLKKSALEKLQQAKNLKIVDQPAVPLLDILNKKKNFFTSSSCFGRIYLINLPSDAKRENAFVVRWHRTVKFSEVKKILDISKGNIWFKMEPLILHISCRTINDAKKILDIKQKCGIKRGGIFSVKDERIQIELEGTLKIDAPVKWPGFQVSDRQLRKLIQLANRKFKKNAAAWNNLKKEFSTLK